MELITIRNKCKGFIVNGRVTDNTLREALAGTDILQKYSCKHVRARIARTCLKEDFCLKKIFVKEDFYQIKGASKRLNVHLLFHFCFTFHLEK